MASLANIRALPGLYGGGFARVVQVETLNNSTSGSAVNQAAVLLERLQDPFSTFRQASQPVSTTTATNTAPAVSKPQPAPDSGSLTLLQTVDAQQSLGPQLPPLGQQAAKQQTATATAEAPAPTDDPSSYAIEIARAEARRQELRTEDDRRATQRADAIRALELANAPKEALAPDPLAKLNAAVKSLSTDVKVQDLSYSDLGVSSSTLAYTAAQAVQAYTSTLAASAEA